MKKISLILETVKHLKPIQIYYRGKYFIRKRVGQSNYPSSLDSRSRKLNFDFFLYNKKSFDSKTFTFLNRSKTFENIDWNFKEFGKLWTYNLNYFDFLNQEEISKNEGLKLIDDYLKKFDTVKDGLEPYPISLRTINWIKFMTRFQIRDKKIDDTLLAQYYILLDNLEYHLLGNHLLENGFSLLWGGIYLQDDILLQKGKEIVYSQLEEQVLEDGGHFELSPMYHQIILFRLLDALNLVTNNSNDKALSDFLYRYAAKMLGWLKHMTLSNSDIPLLNDSANEIAPKSNELFDYAKYLDIDTSLSNLSDSGYRVFKKKSYEAVIDIGQIGPDYIPGHAHADTFNFVLYKHGRPFIIDTGVSTYEANETRKYERSTKAHNTVEINGCDSSVVWDAFKVAQRAKIISVEESENSIEATHDGYFKRFGIYHTRKWIFHDNKIIIEDVLNRKGRAVSRLHFHPDVTKEQIIKAVRTDSIYNIVETYVAFEFNKKVPTLAIEIPFEQKSIVEISIENN